MKDHLSGLWMVNLVTWKKIAGDASQELRLDAENIDEKSQQIFSEKKLFKNPTKIMDIVKKIGSKFRK